MVRLVAANALALDAAPIAVLIAITAGLSTGLPRVVNVGSSANSSLDGGIAGIIKPLLAVDA
jgi:hypothetical protein